MINNFSNIDFLKYKRIFAFGCSFTQWRWPTWADIIKTQCPNAEFHNLGRAGAGNPFIVTQISQASNYYKFTDRDLVMVMFTGHTREDRYLNRQWVTPGNIFTQGFYPEDYVQKYCDPRGFTIRDVALMDLAYRYLENDNCDSIVTFGVPVNFQFTDSADVNDIEETYKNFLDKIPKSMYESVVYNPSRPGYWEPGAYYYDTTQPQRKEKTGDYHPGPMKYYQYLVNLGFNLNSDAHNFASSWAEKIAKCETLEELHAIWPDNYSQPVIK